MCVRRAPRRRGRHRGAYTHLGEESRGGRSWLPGRSRGPLTLHLAQVAWGSEVSGGTQQVRSVLEGFGLAEAEAGQREDVRD